MAASLLSDVATFALPVAFGRAMQQHAPAFSIHGPTAAPASNRFIDTLIGVLVDTVVHIAVARAMQHHVPAFSIHGQTAAPASNSVLDAAFGVLIDTVIGVLVDTVIDGVLRVALAFARAMPQNLPAFSIHGPTAAPASNSLLAAATGVLIDTVIDFLVDIAFGRAVQQHVPAFSNHGRTAAPASNSVLDAAVLLAVHFILFGSLVVAAFVAIVFRLNRAGRASSGIERRLAVAVVEVAVVILAIVSGEDM